MVVLFLCTGMEQYIGLLKVGVIKGTNLVATDFLSTATDPYVVVSLDNQVSANSHFIFASILSILHITHDLCEH